jgi:UMF1 family MFS transporter
MSPVRPARRPITPTHMKSRVRQRAPKREIFGWAMFDFANQAYTLLIITVVFGDLFTRVVVGDAPDYRLGNLLWSLALATSYLLVVLCAPVCGAIMDFTAAKKRFLFASYLLTVVCTALLYFVAPGYALLGVLLIILSNFGYSVGESFIASFLPQLGPPRDLGWISGFGWALGYVGGMVSAIFVLIFLGDVSAENFERIRWVGPWAAFFFLVAAIPTFAFLRERGRRRLPPARMGYWRLGMGRVRKTLGRVRKHPDLWRLLCSVFFSMSGIYVVITFSFIYGSQVIRWDESVRVIMFVLVQITAAIGAATFGLLQNRMGAQRTYHVTLGLWIVAVLAIFATPGIASGLRSLFGVDWQAQHIFLIVGCLSGLALGSCQSATRTLVGLFSPLNRAGEFFGFWGLALKLAGAFSLLALGLFQILVGLQVAVLLCALFFALALAISWNVDEARGRRAAGEEL